MVRLVGDFWVICFYHSHPDESYAGNLITKGSGRLGFNHEIQTNTDFFLPIIGQFCHLDRSHLWRSGEISYIEEILAADQTDEDRFD